MINIISLTLVLDHTTWKSIGIIYSLGTTIAHVPSLVVIKQRGVIRFYYLYGDFIWSTDKSSDKWVQNNMVLFFLQK